MRRVLPLLLIGCVSLGACTDGSTSKTPPTATTTTPPSTPTSSVPRSSSPARGTAYGWPTYHGDNQRTGVSTSAALRPPLRQAWSRQLDGAVYAQPLVVAGSIVVATEHNTVYRLDAKTGSVQWQRHLATPVPLDDLPCGNIDPTGITGTPAYDAATDTLYVATETTASRHTLHALAMQSGQERWHRDLDVLDSRDRRAQQQRSALLVADDTVYVAFGGRFGDCGNYVGYVVGVPTSGDGDIVSYAVPTAREAGIWAPPGLVQGKAGGGLLVASGNGAEVGGKYDGSDSVIELSPTLHRNGLFAPSTWAADNAADLDLGSSAPVVTAFGSVVIAGKRGTVYLLGPDLGGVGGEIDTLDGCAAYGGAATSGQTVLLPCIDGVRALEVAGRSMRWRWALSGVAGSPTIAGDAFYSLNLETGDLVLGDLRSGDVRDRIQIGDVSRFATPVPVGTFVYVGTLDGVVAVRGGT